MIEVSGCDAILTCNSFDDDWLKPKLSRLLWGYSHLADIVFSGYADVRRRNIEQGWTRRNGREAALAESEKEASPPQLSEPPQSLESSAVLWTHAKVEDVNPEYMSQGPGWYTLFNPGQERGFNVTPVHSLAYGRCVCFTGSMAWKNNILFLRII